ncbi:hypothetical protein AwWohl_00520 [Gammaproteobacteria bacterium]|nr:hypothetical protein AwWohl_00520 [Gammaproteobacteria bacterium]
MNQENVNAIQIEEGIYLIDTHMGNKQGATAAYLIESESAVAFFDSGASYSVPYFLKALEQLNYKPEQVQYIFVSHVHLDHFAGTAYLLKHCVNAKVIAHPRALSHCENPEKLIQASAAIYGGIDALEEAFGILLPISPEHLITADFENDIVLGTKKLKLLDSQGHALHHYVLFDRETRTVLAADSFGLSYFFLQFFLQY